MNKLSTISRPRLLAYILLAVMLVFVARLFYLQVIRHDYYKSLAMSEQMRQWELPAMRGEIYALSNGQPVKLVMNEVVYTVWADPSAIEEPDKAEEVLRRVAGGNLRDGISGLLRKKDSRYQVLARNISYKQAEMIKKERVYGLGFERTSRRVYPEGQLASQVTGFVNSEGKGQYGIEAGLDDQLHGKNGLLKTVADVRDVPLTIGKENINIPPQNGRDVVLSIDRNVQSMTERALANGLKKTGARHASAIVIDPRSGRVMAMASLPTYDPEKITAVRDIDTFNNKTITEPYEAGSVIKTFTMATGIDQGVINRGSTFNNTDSIRVDDITINNFTRGQTGPTSMQKAFTWSLNTGMVTIAQRLGDGGYINDKARSTIYSYFHDRLHLGQSTGIELVGEASGTVIPPNVVQGNAVRYSNMVFGQGMDVTMLQVASAFSAVINGGTYYQPSVLAGTVNGSEFETTKPKVVKRDVVSNATSSQVRQMLVEARQAFYADGDHKGYSIGGKTGTSETASGGSYVKDQSIGTYLGYGGEKGELPSYVIMTQISSPGMKLGGGEHAMPIFTEISNSMIRYLKLQPKG